MLKFERESARDAFAMGYLSQRLDGVDGLTADEWIAKAVEGAMVCLPDPEPPEPPENPYSKLPGIQEVNHGG